MILKIIITLSSYECRLDTCQYSHPMIISGVFKQTVSPLTGILPSYQTSYTHYQATIPERNSAPTRSGNYLLKVFLNDDTSKLVFTKRFLVVNNKAICFSNQLHSLLMSIFQNTPTGAGFCKYSECKINAFSPQDLKVVVVQNNVWATSSIIDRPTIFRGNYYEYSDEDTTTFPGR